MASYYPEGECFFIRSGLKYGDGATKFSAENTEQFYTHVLTEYQWNGWVVSNDEFNDNPRPTLKTGYATQYSTQFGTWNRFWVGESENLAQGNMLNITTYPNSLNWNEMRDRDQGGPRKHILRPIKIKDPKTRFLWIDATIPIRAIYFPICQKTDEAFPQYCTYAVIDFKARNNIECYSQFPKEERDPTEVAQPDYGIYKSKVPGEQLFMKVTSRYKWGCKDGHLTHTPDNSFSRQIDLAQVMTATFGLDIGWRPYTYSSYVLEVVTKVSALEDILHADLGDALKDLAGGGEKARKKEGDAENSELTESIKLQQVVVVSLAEENHSRGFSDEEVKPKGSEGETGKKDEGETWNENEGETGFENEGADA